MTTKDIIQHPATANLKLLAIGFAVGLFFQHSVELKEQAQWLSQFLGSEQFKAGLLGVVGIITVFQQALPQLKLGNTLDSTAQASGIGKVADTATPPNYEAFLAAIVRSLAEEQAVKQQVSAAATVAAQPKT